MARGYTRTRVRGCGRSAAELWSAVLRDYDRGAADGQPKTIGEVRQVYDRSAYVEFRPAAISPLEPLGPPLVLLAGPGFDGPLATRLDRSDAVGTGPGQLTVGVPCRLRTAAGSNPNPEYVFNIGGTMDIGIDPAALDPPPRDPVSGPYVAQITRRSPVVDRATTALELLRSRDFRDGLDWLERLPSPGGARCQPADLQSLIEWWSAHLDGAARGPPPMDIVGRGPGATPSGDDVLSGLLLALLRTTSGRRYGRVRDAGRQLVAAAEERTPDISTALLAQAAQGRAADGLEAALEAILAPSEPGAPVEPAVLQAAEIGHTSGVDHLVGELLALLGIVPRFQDRD